MESFIDKRRVAATFRDRLAIALMATGKSRAALARAVGVDRSSPHSPGKALISLS